MSLCPSSHSAGTLARNSEISLDNYQFTLFFSLVQGVYDMVVQRTMVTVKVTETVIEEDEVELICPVVIHPGEFFTCVADIVSKQT